MSHLRLGDIAPDFEQESSVGPIRFMNSWATTGACCSRIPPISPRLHHRAGLHRQAGRRVRQAQREGAGAVRRRQESHNKWIEDINDTQSTTVNFPILADKDRKVSELYDMIHPNANATLTVRSVFIIDPNKKVRLTITYPASTGRNFNEILRVIDSLQLTDSHSVATPVNWQDGDDVIIVPSLQDEAVIKQKFPKGYKAVRPYLRITPQPNK